jgi:hypothetical protein
LDSDESGGEFAGGTESAVLQCFVSILRKKLWGVRVGADYGNRVHDNSERYVAEENVELLEVVDQEDVDAFPIAVGRFFKRWDGERNIFVSNVTDEYPED